ncbi:single-stranded DNA-binding protein [Geobacillus stearothermophilus]|uniref:single-stranded DNA-binding protein n=1 Tax=Geobacillus stearothermophilus TaxID=1422 RepID=UPI002E1B4852|nr:single-stranded DNA-binding protein [Geobacillus stearothermophilus]
MNRVVLVGRLTKDAELRYTSSGVAVASFTLAVNRPFANQQGEREADFVNVVAWRKTAENLANYTKKGSMIGVDGRIQTRSYEKDGRRVYVTEVVADTVQFLGRSGSNTAEKQQGNSKGAVQQKDASKTAREAFSKPPEMEWGNDDPFGGEPVEFNDDDLPF